MTAQGHPRALFKRAIERGNLVVADATARELGQLSLADALDLLALMGRFNDHRFDRAAVRWLQRLLDERRLTLVDVQLVAVNTGRTRTRRCADISADDRAAVRAVAHDAGRARYRDAIWRVSSVSSSQVQDAV